jgi:hypothetical protein
LNVRNWNITDDVLVGSKVRYFASFSAATYRDAASGIVKGFRMPARRRREGMHGGRRPKSLEGGNRGAVRTGGGVRLWGFSAGV